MVKKYEKHRTCFKHHIKADVIILGCSLPGIVTAHNLKKKFGDTMEIVVLDLAGRKQVTNKHSRCNVAFQDEEDDEEAEPPEIDGNNAFRSNDTVARFYLEKYAKEFNIRVPTEIVTPLTKKHPHLNKLFQYSNGSIVPCKEHFHEFDYLNFMERFELAQYHAMLDTCMHDLFCNLHCNSEVERKKLLYFDQTTMEDNICGALLFPTSREVMRTIVSLVCGTSADNVSLLFYLHQCYRTNNPKNHVDGDNTRFREKLLGYYRKQFAHKLLKSIADITLKTKAIKEIRTYRDEQVILEPTIGETDYTCNLLAMAIRPDQLNDIQVESELLNDGAEMIPEMREGVTRKFVVSYTENIWVREGYSGDILSVMGPIIWAMESPKIQAKESMERPTLIGYLKVSDDVDLVDSKEAVLDQLVKLFGPDAAYPVYYHETRIRDIFIPRRGDYVALRMLTKDDAPRYLEWGALDIFADGDIAAAIEAGHNAYVHLLSCLRPQAVTFEDATCGDWLTTARSPFANAFASINVINTSRFIIYGVVIVLGIKLIRSHMKGGTT